MTCNTDALVAMVTGEMDDPLEVAEILDHADICPECEVRLATIVAVRAAAGADIGARR